jgi:hypothetical protein
VYEVETEGDGLIRRIKSIRRISSEGETAIHDDEMDLTNRTKLIEIAEDICDAVIKTVVFVGVDKHVTFVHEPDPSEVRMIEVIDVTPPDPPWLWYNIERLRDILGSLSVGFIPHFIDLRELKGENIIFPCYTSGLKGTFLDSMEEIEMIRPKLVGCDISKAIFEERFDLEYEYVNICPLKSHPSMPFITRCCVSSRPKPVTIDGIRGAVVHWGANPLEIIEGVKIVLSQI